MNNSFFSRRPRGASSLSHASNRWTCAALAWATVACAASPPSPPAAPPARAAAEVEAPPPAPAATPATEAEHRGATAESVVSLIAKPGLWPLDHESAHRVLATLGPVNREQPSPEALALVGGPYGALERYDVAYALDEERYWVFGSAGFRLEAPDPVRLYEALQAHLTQLLGKPMWVDEASGAELPASAWDLGEAITLSLSPSADGGECLVRIASAAPETRR